ncbi:uncharacterized protein LOC133833701 [Humulus lupulus]|uniref:uncharacterized protein LOC133833701 n=1 Tax=Humulus lupulus TaxID=3486 RepID=UPI002B417615|nr:uncharacterized protein LOC133833701 [Humulus lupulus]
MLAIIDPDDHTCYYLDPLRKSPPNDLKNLMNNVSSHIKRKTGRNEKNYKWKIVNCPRQTSSVECGFYIIRMMKDYCLNETPMRWLTSNCGGKNTYTLGEINETRNEWVAKLLERMSHS